ncbi:MAG: hypothetical protein ABSE41_06140 [Bacteroidota bacterium]
MSSRRFPWLFVLTLFLPFVACTDRGEQPVESQQPGGVPDKYIYKAYNSKGDLAVSGTMTLVGIDTTSVSGTWSFVEVLPSEKVGPQVGTGNLTGTIQKSSISINLNPGWVDNNVFLQGTVSADSITGRWMWSTFIALTAEGKFQAIRTIPTHISNN